jgi:hypothetical protein
MKKYIILFLLFIFFLFNSSFLINKPSYQNRILTYKGLINKKIPIFLWYTIKDKVLYGQLTYLNTKQNKPIRIIGTIENGEYRIFEFEKNGNITGILTVSKTKENLNGDWFSPKTRAEYSLKLTPIDTVIHKDLTGFKGETNTGEYRFLFSKNGSEGYFKLSNLNKTNFLFEIQNNTEGPAYNQAIIENAKVQIKENIFLFSPSETRDCQFKTRLYKDFIIIDYIKDKDCGFGHNASVDGIYLRTK